MNLAEHFLIATPSLRDPMFEHSVVLIGEHQESGAMGIVINKPSPVHMEVVFAAIGQNTPARFAGQYVMMGGPVQTERGFVLHTPVGNWESSLHINDELALTTSRDIIDGLAKDDEIDHALLTIGYSSWKKGQLEHEVAQNDWLVVPADQNILFHTPPEERYQAALHKLGIRLENLMGAGHA
ncbi:YqgE/AlgH family protein [Kingella kingae]|uniref:YqgE/AlgH family protein n=1 Tax=Kingella kingae TaxID=504 RepID=UPI00035EA05C|nr:YqgE/AlgH family protein [Kingella kingae]MDK4544134.1 YqgE/AlgH family protein [Kingella kingae]MDK4555779.1 YqgE/AlgH family protein [Kingella kingae]MDK4584889.1 YqgE/AlgH family protein [Kingella kingae]MDK4588888.1 YqgE/AlgH family protein [Kingella kingae]MDK4595921.1 YqgE/AlgH family protein [Kingella kingae]